MLRLSFGVPSIEDIRRGVNALARAIKHSSL
jgi:DNA-binding transcriptional MocR family regulator